MFEALMIAGKEVQRVTARLDAFELLERSVEITGKTDADWDVVVAGDCLDELELAARKSLSGSHGRLRQAGLAIFGGVRGTGLPALVQELGLAANRAARFRSDAKTAFVFKDATLVDALANNGRGLRLSERHEQEGLVAVLAKPGYDVPWRRRG